MKTISEEQGQAAYEAAVKRAKENRLTAAICRKIAGTMDGKIINCRIVDRVKPLVPDGVMLTYYHPSYNSKSRWLNIYYTPRCSEYCSIRLYNINDKDDNKIHAADLIVQAEEMEKRAEQIEKQLETFFDRLSQYNNLLNYLHQLTGEMQAVAYCYRDWHWN